MPEYLVPGVYVEEIQQGPRPIEGVSTSTAGFVGETERGATTPTLVTSWQSYYGWFGDYVDRQPGTPNIYLPYAVRGFFDNGGQRLFIARSLVQRRLKQPRISATVLCGQSAKAPGATI